MKKHASLTIAVFCSVALAPIASAHVSLTYPKGGETFAPGTQVTIEWQLLVHHSQVDWDLYFSSDGGVTWDTLASNLSVSLRSYDWTVPEIETMHARIKVVQDNTGLDYESSCDDFSIQAVASSTEGSESVPASTELLVGYPNPFITTTSIEFTLSRSESVSLEIFDILGVKVATLVAGPLSAGRHVVSWQPSELANGVYLARLAAAEGVQNIRLVLGK